MKTNNVEKRGSRWCVVHGHPQKPGSKTDKPKGTVIKCFATKAEAMAMHRAIMASQARAKGNEEEKEWMKTNMFKCSECGWTVTVNEATDSIPIKTCLKCGKEVVPYAKPGSLRFNKDGEAPKVNGLRHLMSALIRREELDGAECLVIPTVLICEGVHNKCFYKGEELAKYPDSWNGRPVCIDIQTGHPQDEEGRAITANSPDLVEKIRVGELFNTEWIAPKLHSEAWINIEKLLKVEGGDAVLKMLEEDKNVEVSTGLFTDDIVQDGDWNGEKYDTIVVNYRPDHLVLLPFDKGACSWNDGAGLPRVNTRGEGQGVGGERQGDGGTGTCVCPKCGATMKHNRGTPCSSQKCPKCGASMVGATTNKEIITDIQSLKAKAAEMGFSVNELSHGDIHNSLTALVREGLGSDEYVYIRDVFDRELVYEKEKNGKATLFKQAYSVNAKEEVSLVDGPVQVQMKVDFVPVMTNVSRKSRKGGNRMDREARIKALAEKITDLSEEDREMLKAIKTDEQFERITNAMLVEPKDNEAEEAARKATKEEEEAAAKAKETKGNEDKPKTLDESLAEMPKDLAAHTRRALARENAYKDELVKQLKENKRCSFTEDQLRAKDVDELEVLADMAEVEVDYSGVSVGDMATNEDDSVPEPPDLVKVLQEKRAAVKAA